MSVISVSGLRKTYGDVVAVDGLSLDVGAGEVYALLGHNGAGKSTTIEILEGHRDRTAGEVSVLGVDPASGGRELRNRIGIVLQSSGIETELTVREAIEHYRSCYRSPRAIVDVVDVVDLGSKIDERIGSLSGGQRRRLDLALGIVGRPELLFLDEPTTGFDAAARRRAWSLIDELRSDGTTIVLTTHYLDEAERLADRVGVMVAGRMAAEGTPEQLVSATADTVVSFALPEGVGAELLEGLAGSVAATTRRVGQRIEFTSVSPTADVHALTGWALAHGIELAALSVERPSLEDVFLGLGEPAADDGCTDHEAGTRP